MQLAWHFFGYSDTYNLFIAFGEITAALLWVIPKTATLGNIIYLPITVNITILDFCFEIPARSVSTLLTCMSIALLFFEYKKLKRVFFDSPVAAETSIPTNLTKKKVNIQWSYYLLCLSFLGFLLFTILSLKKKLEMNIIYNHS
jgi:hypothetical protein